MRFSNRGRLREQVRILKHQFVQDGALPFSDILTDDFVRQAMAVVVGCWKDRIYTPVMTLWIFLSQVLSADHSCRSAVARFIAYRGSRDQTACSTETGAYCHARKRLPEQFFSTVAVWSDVHLDVKAAPPWLWKNSSRVNV